MASHYCVNRRSQTNGDHEVHTYTCTYLPAEENRHYLGVHESCVTAVSAARQSYPTANGCYFCSNYCHTT